MQALAKHSHVLQLCRAAAGRPWHTGAKQQSELILDLQGLQHTQNLARLNPIYWQALANTPRSCCPAELQALQSALSAEELKAKGEQLQKQLAGKQAKLAALKTGKDLITKGAERQSGEGATKCWRGLLWYR